MTQKVENLLKKNHNDWAIFSMINNAKINEKTVIGWKILAGKKVTVEVQFSIIRKFRNEIIIKAIGSHKKEKLRELTAGSQKLNFYLPDDLVLFQCEVKQVEQNGDVRVVMPSMIAQVDRRKDLRLFIEGGMNVDLNFFKENHAQRKANQKFAKQCFDISAGGLAFIVSNSEKKFFKEKDVINHLHVNLDNFEFDIRAHVVKILEVEPNSRNELNYKGWKVCIKYLNLTADVKKEIESFIFKYIDFDEAI